MRCNAARLFQEIRGHGRFEEGCYTRTTLVHGEGYVVMLLCWPPGVSSPVHAHSDALTKVKSSCFMLVLDGELSETVYEGSAILSDTSVALGEGQGQGGVALPGSRRCPLAVARWAFYKYHECYVMLCTVRSLHADSPQTVLKANSPLLRGDFGHRPVYSLYGMCAPFTGSPIPALSATE